MVLFTTNTLAYADLKSSAPPDDFVWLSEQLPSGLDRQLGYFGTARYCIVYNDPRADGVIWRDGESYGFGCGAWRPFSEYIEPLAKRYGVPLGGSASAYVLVMDRRTRGAFFAPRRSAEQFIQSQHLDHLQGLKNVPESDELFALGRHGRGD